MERETATPEYIRPYVGAAPDDRRRHPRLRSKGAAEIRFLVQKVRVSGVMVELSLSGCSIDCDQPVPRVNQAAVEVCLTIFGIRVLLGGVIRNTRRQERRVGIEFAQVTPRKAEQIRHLVHELMENDAPIV